MEAIEEILKIIDTKQEVPIVAEEKLIERINELRDIHLIEIVDDKIKLTEEGKVARIKGIFRTIHTYRFQLEMQTFSSENLKKHQKIFRCCLTACLTLWVLFLLSYLGILPVEFNL